MVAQGILGNPSTVKSKKGEGMDDGARKRPSKKVRL
jgi:hypothetical protein